MIEDKLDKIIDLLEKLVPKDITINQAIYKGKDFDESKFNEILKGITNRINRASGVSPRVISKEEFIGRTKMIDWEKILEPKISLLDEKGKDIGVKCNIQEEGSVICEPMKKDATVVGWSLKENMTNIDKLQTISEEDPIVITYSLSNLAIKLDKKLKGQWHGDTEIGDKEIYLKFLGRDEQGRMRLGAEVR